MEPSFTMAGKHIQIIISLPRQPSRHFKENNRGKQNSKANNDKDFTSKRLQISSQNDIIPE